MTKRRRKRRPEDVFRPFYGYESNLAIGIHFVCPACSTQYGYEKEGWLHHFHCIQPNEKGILWRVSNSKGRIITADNIEDFDFDGLDANPSLGYIARLVNGKTRYDCHLEVKSGKINYMADSLHAMAGRTVEIRPFGDYER